MYEGKLVRLRAYEKKDIEIAHKYYNNLEFVKLLNGGILVPLSYENEEEFLMSATKHQPNSYHFAIETLKESKYIGGCSYFKFSPKNRTAWIGLGIADVSSWGKGYGTDTLEVLINFLFNELNVRKITLGVYGYNERAIRLYKKVGFIEEGRLREHMYRNGQYHDEIFMSLFR